MGVAYCYRCEDIRCISYAHVAAHCRAFRHPLSSELQQSSPTLNSALPSQDVGPEESSYHRQGPSQEPDEVDIPSTDAERPPEVDRQSSGETSYE